MNTIVDTAPPPAPQLPRIEPTDILRAAGHMGIGNAPTNSTATAGHPKPDAPIGDNSKNIAKKSATKPNKPKAPPP